MTSASASAAAAPRAERGGGGLGRIKKRTKIRIGTRAKRGLGEEKEGTGSYRTWMIIAIRVEAVSILILETTGPLK